MNGWGNNNGLGGGNGGAGAIWPYFTSQNTDSQVRSGFDTASLAGQLSAIQAGQSAAEVSACGRAMDQMKATYDAQIAGMNQRFGDALALQGNLNDINNSLQNCCCENRAGIADLKYTVATEACADRQAVTDALGNVLTTINAGIQSIKDQMCQDKIDAKNDEIAQLRQQVAMKDLAASEVASFSGMIWSVYTYETSTIPYQTFTPSNRADTKTSGRARPGNTYNENNGYGVYWITSSGTGNSDSWAFNTKQESMAGYSLPYTNQRNYLVPGFRVG